MTATTESPAAAAPKAASPSKFGGKRVKLIAIIVGLIALPAVAAALLLPKGQATSAATHAAAGGHSAEEPHAPKGEGLVEVEIGKFSVSIELEDAILWNVSFTLFAAVESVAQSEIDSAVNEHFKARVRQAVVKVVRTSSIKDIKDPQLENLKKFLKTEINNVLPHPVIREVIISEIRTMQQ